MKIHHMAAYVLDVEISRAFYEKYFNTTASNLYYNPKKELKIYYLYFEDGGIFEIMSKPGVSPINVSTEHIGYTHLSLSVSTRELVDQITDRLRNDGFTIFGEPRINGAGMYESCVSDPDGNRIEIEAAIHM